MPVDLQLHLRKLADPSEKIAKNVQGRLLFLVLGPAHHQRRRGKRVVKRGKKNIPKMFQRSCLNNKSEVGSQQPVQPFAARGRVFAARETTFCLQPADGCLLLAGYLLLAACRRLLAARGRLAQTPNCSKSPLNAI